MDCYYNWMGICRFYCSVPLAGPVSGAHLNPINTGLALVGKFAWNQVATFMSLPNNGAMLGSFWFGYPDHCL
jgi:glycerol uptake facilitator protein